jgi:hypothetical protein
MLEQKELHFIEQQIEGASKKISDNFDPPYDNKHGSFQMYSAQETDELIIYYIQQYFHLLSAYFEAKGLTEYRNRFVQKFGLNIQKTSKVSEVGYHDGEPYLIMLVEMTAYLAPFKALAHNYSPKGKSRLSKVIEIIDETPMILRKLGITPNKEADVYKAVGWVLDFYYTLPPINKSQFTGKLKRYVPDILLPEIETAIEFKFASANKNLEDYIDEIVSDAVNYKGDSDYNQFIAVLCIQNNQATKAKIQSAWDNKNFNKNWHNVTISL